MELEVRQVDEADGHAVGIGVSQLGPADGAGAALDVLDDDGLADILLGVLGKDTGGIVGAGACLVGHDHSDGAIGFKVSIGGDAQSEHHAQDECERKDFFHCFSSFFLLNRVTVL